MKKITLLTTLLFVIVSTINAQVTATGAFSIIESGTITDVTHDADNGDGLNDGAKYVDGSDNVSVTAGAAFTFDGSIEDGTSYTVNTTLYNYNNSYCTVEVSLYNKTDETLLTTSTSGLQGVGHAGGDDIDAVELTYTAVSSDDGDVLEIRYIKTQAGSSRNFAIDILQLGGVAVGPTPLSTEGVWAPIGDTLMSNVTDDADNGDGVNDGAIFVDGQSVAVGQGISYTFDDEIKEGLDYEIVTNIYNSGASYNKVVVSLYNVTDGLELVSSGTTNLPGGSVVEITLSYTALSSDEGDVLELRYVKDFDGNTSRDFSIDNAYIGGSAISTDLSVLSTENDLLEGDVSIYPIPAKDVLNIKSNVAFNKIILLDVTGRSIYINDFETSINVADFPSGVYYLVLESVNAHRVTKKIILE